MRQLPPEAALFHTTKRDPGIGHAVGVDKDPAGFQLVGDAACLLRVGGEHTGGQAELTVVGEGHGVVRIAGGDDGGDRAKQFLFERGHLVGDVGQHGGGVVVARAFDFAAAQQQGGAFGQGGLDLAVEFVPQVEPGHRPDVGLAGGRVAHHQVAAGFEEFGGEGFHHAFFDDQALGGGAHLAGVLETADQGSLHGFVEVGVVEHNERVGTAQLQYAFFQRGPGLGTDGHAGAHAAGEGHGGDARVGDGFGHAVLGDVDHFEQAIGKAGALEGLFHQVRAAHYVRRVLEHVGVAAEHGWHRAAQHLPHREVPRHYREDRAQRAVFDLGGAVVHQGGFRGQHGWAVGRIPLSELRAFFDFATGLGDGFAHFQGDHLGHFFGLVAQGAGQGQQQFGALGDGGIAPVAEGVDRAGEGGIQLRLGFVRVAGDRFTVGGVDR